MALFRWAEVAAGRWPGLRWLYAVPNAGGFSGGFRANVARVARLKREGVRPGVPDVVLPVRCGGFGALYLELKRTDRRVSRVTVEQRAWHEYLTGAGYRVAVCYGHAVAIAVITDYLSMEDTA